VQRPAQVEAAVASFQWPVASRDFELVPWLYWTLATGNLLGTGCWKLENWERKLETGNWQLATGNWQLATGT